MTAPTRSGQLHNDVDVDGEHAGLQPGVDLGHRATASSRAPKGQTTTTTGPKISSVQIGSLRDTSVSTVGVMNGPLRLPSVTSVAPTATARCTSPATRSASPTVIIGPTSVSGLRAAHHKGFGAPGERGQGAVVNAAVHRHPLHGEQLYRRHERGLAQISILSDVDN